MINCYQVQFVSEDGIAPRKIVEEAIARAEALDRLFSRS